MNKFEYTLPSGAKYVLTAPPGSTQAQADAIFYSQVAAGNLVGYETGQTLQNVTVSPITYELSRQSRGTAGVPGTVSAITNTRAQIVASLYNSLFRGYYDRWNPSPGPGPGPGPGPSPGPGPNPGPNPGPSPRPPIPPVPPSPDPAPPIPPGPLPPDRNWNDTVPVAGPAGAFIAGIFAQTETPSQGYDGYLNPTEIDFIASIVQNLPIINSIPDLSKIPIEKPVDQADVMLAKGERISPESVSVLSPFQVQALQAQITNLVDQPFTEISQEKGVGKYGLTCYQLEKAGYVKPGTSARYIDLSPVDFVSVMNSPSLWTGKNGITSLNQYLSKQNLQDSSNNYLLQQGYQAIVNSGIITDVPEQEVSYDTAWIFTDTGLQPLGSRSVYAQKNNGNLGGLSFSLVPSASYDTLVNGVTTEDAVNNLDLAQYNYNKVQNSTTNEVNKNLGALVSASGKFGPELTSVWAAAANNNTFNQLVQSTLTATNSRNVLLSQLGGAASLFNGSISTINPINGVETVSAYSQFAQYGASGIPSPIVQSLLTPMTQLNGGLSVYGKAAQYAINYTNQSVPIGDIINYNNLNDIYNNVNPATTSDIIIQQLINSGVLLDNLQNNPALKNLIFGITDLSDISGILNFAAAYGNLSNFLGGLQIFGNLFGGNSAFTSGVVPGIGYSDTVNRSTVDIASQKILGNPKIPQPVYSYPGNFWQKIIEDITRANQKMSDAAKLGDAFAPSPTRIYYSG